MANYALLVQKIEQVLPQEQHKCWPGSLVRQARPLGVIVASEHTDVREDATTRTGLITSVAELISSIPNLRRRVSHQGIPNDGRRVPTRSCPGS